MKNKISCVITDDEPLARKGLRGYVDKTDFLELRGVFEDAFQLSEFMRANPVDLLFLDIQMPDFTGIEFLKTLKNPPKVIFTTAFEQYAIEGFELEIMDYLLKPISYERFLKGVSKAQAYFNSKKQPDSYLDYLFVKVDGKLEKIAFSDVLFIEGMENYVAIHLPNKKLVTHMTIKALLEKLPKDKFARTHKSYLVAFDKVESIEGNNLFIGKHKIPVSKYLKNEVLSKIMR
ncbi:LytR/AlgR family response regulator transcription factor [Mucilaginibacter lappiensis]|uniref:LytR/AlgR family response regulator transcription factor n=1 Tax=Mucilaginibacter lappiensis TaxID=354630 RepID=UPI003D2088D2